MWRAVNITTITTKQVSAGEADLVCVVVNTGAAGAICKIFDGIANTGLPVASIDASAPNTFFYGCTCLSGITAVTSVGSADITVVYVDYTTPDPITAE